jgi:hypothetical protein
MGTKDQRAPFRYVMTWKKAENERIAVEARYQNFLKGRGREEALELGWVEGTRCSLMRGLARNIERRYRHGEGDGTVTVDLPYGPAGEDIGRRMALIAAVLQEAPATAALERAYEYLDAASSMEINFWASKLLDHEVGPQRVVPAVLLVSRAMRVRPAEPEP